MSAESTKKAIDMISGVNPLSKSTTVYAVLVLVLAVAVVMLWSRVEQQNADFIQYMQRRDTEMNEVLTRISVRLDDQEDMNNQMDRIENKIDRVLEK